MQAGGKRSGRLVRWLEDDYIQVAKESPACKYVMPELVTTLRFAASSIAARFPSSAPCRHFKEIRSVATLEGRFYNDQDNEEARNVAFLGSDTKKQLSPKGKRSPERLDEWHPLHGHRNDEAQGSKLQLRRLRHPQNLYSV